MPEDILLWIPLNLFTFLVVHIVFAVIGLAVKAMNEKYITTENLVYALFFGVFYFLNQIWDANAVVLDFRNHAELDRQNKIISDLTDEIATHINEKYALIYKIEEMSGKQQAVEDSQA